MKGFFFFLFFALATKANASPTLGKLLSYADSGITQPKQLADIADWASSQDVFEASDAELDRLKVAVRESSTALPLRGLNQLIKLAYLSFVPGWHGSSLQKLQKIALLLNEIVFSSRKMSPRIAEALRQNLTLAKFTPDGVAALGKSYVQWGDPAREWAGYYLLAHSLRRSFQPFSRASAVLPTWEEAESFCDRLVVFTLNHPSLGREFCLILIDLIEQRRVRRLSDKIRTQLFERFEAALEGNFADRVGALFFHANLFQMNNYFAPNRRRPFDLVPAILSALETRNSLLHLGAAVAILNLGRQEDLEDRLLNRSRMATEP